MVTRVHANLLKSVGYLISTLSVLLLGIVAWSSASKDPDMRAALIVGMAASIVGMLMRWLSYQVRERKEGNQSALPTSSRLRT